MRSPVRPERLALLGHPVAHSLSPRMQNAALRAAGLSATYEAIDVAPHDLPAVIQRCITEGIAGNVTVPHKEAVAQMCAKRTELADRVGAVNVFWVDQGALVGDNTDAGGFDEAITEMLGGTLQAPRVALLGVGGSAAAVAFAISAWPEAQLALWGRTAARAEHLRARLHDARISIRIADSAADAVKDATLVVNATPLGMSDDLMPIAPELLSRDTACFDLVYRPGETAWVRAARERGHVASDGLPMLIAQGALAFERWFGVVPDRAVMKQAASESHRER